ncbi:hypothetical protein [Mycobacterium sp. SMC-4]|uniref:DUF7257 domain-containing protein n=1 Tax=Mycobacterium sp. SMC-4 TaxID=2857059 RepID=UPI0021B3560A|nr:hypothetical protein [Mycobacterium sp. SMC-4]UXA19556.1 hypothetical protein KXD98_08140 [Mycobacterium sp. SMC-4]
MSAPKLPFPLAEIATETTVYPTGQVTILGEQLLLEHVDPMLSFSSLDRRFTFHFSGPMAPWPKQQDGVQLLEITPPSPGFKHLKAKGARQHGVTWNATTFDETQINMVLKAFARTPELLGQVVSDWVAMWHPTKLIRFEWLTFDKGLWWCDCRLSKVWNDRIQSSPRRHREQVLTHVIENAEAFWRSVDSMSTFEFQYEDFTDTFNTDYPDDMGPDWPLLYSGDGEGHAYTQGGTLRWRDDPDSVFFTSPRGVVCGPYVDADSGDDTDEVSIVFGSFAEAGGSANDLWIRMNRDENGDWGGDGVRARWIYNQYLKLSYFVDFVEYEIRTEFEFFAAFPGERFTFRGGVGGNLRRFQMLRGTRVIFDRVEEGTGSRVGPDHRGRGFGLRGGGAVYTQATPARVREFKAKTVVLDSFNTPIAVGLGENWPLHYYEGDGDAHIYVTAGTAAWNDNSGTSAQQVIYGPRRDFHTDTDNQVESVVLDTIPEWSLPESGKFYLGCRMNRDENGDWAGDGVFAEVGRSVAEIVRYNNFVRTPMWWTPIWPPPFWGEKYTLIAGQDGSPRTFKLLRNGAPLLNRTEAGEGSAIGPDHRGAGGGLYAGAALITQATPPRLRKIAAGDNATVTQSGFLNLTNVGSEEGWPTIVFRGPGTIGVGNGPGSQDMITFGPLNENQQVLISTHPRYRNIIDLTTAGELTGKQRQQVEDMAKRIALGQVPPLLSWYESVFGVLPPQGNLYEQLEGRFSRPIPGVDQPSDAVTSKIALTVVNGNANTRVLAAVTPLRRWPE